MWRPIDAGLATLREIEEHWGMDDLLDAHEYLDIKEDLEAQADIIARNKK